jgi:hypothetical protein
MTNPPSIYIRPLEGMECHIVSKPNTETAQMYIRYDVVVKIISDLSDRLSCNNMISYNANDILEEAINEAEND